MAIQYTTGTINQPDAGSVGLSMVEKIRDDVVAHAAWDLVEEFTPSGGAVRWYVFKCLGTSNGYGLDFFVIVGRTLSTGKLTFTICEGYATGGHSMQFYPRRSGSGVTYDSEGRATDTQVLGTTEISAGSPNPQFIQWSPAGTSTKWWIIVDDDGFTVAFNGASNGFFHCGGYIPLTELPIDLPIQFIGYADSIGGICRNPAVEGISSAFSSSAHLMFGGGGSSVGNGQFLGFRGELRYNDKLQNNQRPVAEQGMIMSVSTGEQAQNGFALGKQKRMRVTDTATPVGFAFGDAYALGGTLWVPFSPTDPRMWDTGVASS